MKPNAVADHAKTMQATPQTEVVSPVTAAELSAFLGVDATDPLLDGMLVAATDAAIRWINQDLTPRAWLGIIPAQSGYEAQLSPYTPQQSTFEIPYTALIAVQSVTADGDDVPYTLEALRRPAKITLTAWDRMTEVEVAYTAGLPSVPTSIKTAIMMIAAFMYEHRGQCEADDAVRKSGAATLLRPYKVEVVI